MTYRKFANTNKMMDTFTGKYGIQLIKRTTMLVWLEEQEDVQLSRTYRSSYLHENQLKLRKLLKYLTNSLLDDIESEDIGDDLDDMMGLGDVESEDDDKDLEEIEEIKTY